VRHRDVEVDRVDRQLQTIFIPNGPRRLSPADWVLRWWLAIEP